MGRTHVRPLTRGLVRARDAVAAAAYLAALALAAGCSPVATSVDRPNLVVIIGDDHGYGDSGFMGNAIVETPHLDRLAAEGTVFTHGYTTASTCRPSLLSMLTGLQPYQVELYTKRLVLRGERKNDVNRILDLRTLPELLALRGYTSFQAGKHWDGSARQAGFADGTKKGHLSGGTLARISGGSAGLDVGRGTMQPVWEFLDRVGDQPFLLWFAPMLPHAPMDAPASVRERYRGADLEESALAYYANVSRLDDAVGALLARLDAMGVADRTLVVYLSDNGWDQPPDVAYDEDHVGKLGGVRGKMSMHDLGFRTPIVFRWPGRVPAGAVFDPLVSTLDLLPTLLDYAGLVAPPGGEGRTLRPVIEGAEEAAPRTLYGWMEEVLPDSVGRESMSWNRARQPASFARTERWHYVAFEGTGPGQSDDEHLYDLEADPGERVDVADAHPHALETFRAGVAQWKRDMKETLPRRGGRTSEWRAPPRAGDAAGDADPSDEAP